MVDEKGEKLKALRHKRALRPAPLFLLPFVASVVLREAPEQG